MIDEFLLALPSKAQAAQQNHLRSFEKCPVTFQAYRTISLGLCVIFIKLPDNSDAWPGWKTSGRGVQNLGFRTEQLWVLESAT